MHVFTVSVSVWVFRTACRWAPTVDGVELDAHPMLILKVFFLDLGMILTIARGVLSVTPPDKT